MKKRTLRKILSLYSLIFIGSVLALSVLSYILLNLGERYHFYSFANSEEKEVQSLQERIKKEGEFSPGWVPKHITYTVFNNNDEVILSNGSEEEQKRALNYIKDKNKFQGRNIPLKDGYFLQTSYPKGTCVFMYHIGARYSSKWANKYLPSLEIVILFWIFLIVLIPTIVFAHRITKRLSKDISPLKKTVMAIGEGNLAFPVPVLSIEEFKELGTLMERMRLDLKRTLETLWVNEHQLKEETIQMLHDIRSPLTVARANGEFLKEDLSQLEDLGKRESLLKYTQTLQFQLERLEEVANHLQQQMNPTDALSAAKQVPTFREFHSTIDEVGKVLSQHYKGTWKSLYEESTEPLPVEEESFKQVLINVITNAFEHGSSPQTVVLECAITTSEVHYQITNTGSAFSKNSLHHGLEKNFSEKIQNDQIITGYGLYFAKSWIKDQGGTIKLRNTKKGYACVEITIPLKKSYNL